MRPRSRWVWLLALLAVTYIPVACSTGSADGPQPDEDVFATIKRHPQKRLCGEAPPGLPRCHAMVRTLENGEIEFFASPQAEQGAVAPPPAEAGFTAKDLQEAYQVPSGNGGAGKTVAIVALYDNPKAEEDLQVYRSAMGLLPCTSADGCFRKVNHDGQPAPLPAPDPKFGWQGEIALDLDMVSALCPECKILLVEASSEGLVQGARDPMAVANATAVRLGATVVSNSWGSPEAKIDQADDTYFNSPNVAIFVSSGDDGYNNLAASAVDPRSGPREEGPNWPATSPYVISVGGTSLVRKTADGNGRGWAEQAWAKAGSSCSGRTANPEWQTGTPCKDKKMVADVSAVADTDTGVAVYNTAVNPGGSPCDGGALPEENHAVWEKAYAKCGCETPGTCAKECAQSLCFAKEEAKECFECMTKSTCFDVAAVACEADPQCKAYEKCVPVSAGTSGWTRLGGTSAAAPIVAAIFAKTGNGSVNGSFIWKNPTAFNDVTSGSNGKCKGPLCNAQTGPDGPTGVGTPGGTALAALAGNDNQHTPAIPSPRDAGGSPPSLACTATTTEYDCYTCCASAYPEGVVVFNKAFDDCACAAPGTCKNDCAQSFCLPGLGANPVSKHEFLHIPGGDPTCNTCLTNAQACDQTAATTCDANPTCVPFGQCIRSCAGKP